MGTSAGNIGRKMYSSLAWRKAVSDGTRYKRIIIEKECKKCKLKFSVVRLVKPDGVVSISKKERKFCSLKCANSHVILEKMKKHLSLKFSKRKIIVCYFCKKDFKARNGRKFCKKKCFYEYRKTLTESRRRYRLACTFTFSLKDYPNQFNTDLIKEFGWYKAKNHGNNLNGISRDHIVSVGYGYENSIPPEIIAHPANCQLLRHNENVSKGKRNDIMIEELLQKIEDWDMGLWRNGSATNLQLEG